MSSTELSLCVSSNPVAFTELSVHVKLKILIIFEEGRYSVNLPVKKCHPLLPSNYSLSLCRLKSLKYGLSNDNGLLRHYDQVFQEQPKGRIIKRPVPQEALHIYHSEKLLRMKVLRQ